MKYGMTWHDMDSHAPWVAENFEKAASGDRCRRKRDSLSRDGTRALSLISHPDIIHIHTGAHRC